MMKRLYIENHTKPMLGDVPFKLPTHSFFFLSLYILTLSNSLLCSAADCCGIITIMQQDLPNMSTTTIPCRNNHPSKPGIVGRAPASSFSSSKSNDIIKPSFGLHEVVKLEDSCSYSKKVVVQQADPISSLLVSREGGAASHDGSNNDVHGEALQKDSGRERLKRHREEVAGRVRIPDKWGKEELLRDWMDYSSFDSLLAPRGLASARRALMEEGRRAGSHQRLRIESMC